MTKNIELIKNITPKDNTLDLTTDEHDALLEAYTIAVQAEKALGDAQAAVKTSETNYVEALGNFKGASTAILKLRKEDPREYSFKFDPDTNRISLNKTQAE